MSCVRPGCQEVTALELIGAPAPKAAFLCVRHFTERRCSNADCERVLLLSHCAATGVRRTVCAWCALGRPQSVNVTTAMLPVPIRRGIQ